MSPKPSQRFTVKLVSVEEGISALGFRRIAAVARQIDPSVGICFLAIGNLYSLASHLFPSKITRISERDIENIATDLSGYDLVCFSSLSPSASYVEELAARIKRRNPKAFIVWGGKHCIISPEQAIAHVDAICTGEGEEAFKELYFALRNQTTYCHIPGMWFNSTHGVIRNAPAKLFSNQQLDALPAPFDDLSCTIYDFRHHGFRALKNSDYIEYNGLSYRTIWTLGCPFSCSYCCNSAFASVDKDYTKIRRPSVEHLLSEIEHALSVHPYITTIVFYDDNFIALPMEELERFAQEYIRRINLPFVVFGMHPNLVTHSKVELLARAGMCRARMGIQSLSPRTLDFYKRTTAMARIKASATILSTTARRYRMIPPAFDIISDNPVESRSEIAETLQNLYRLPRPYTLNVFSLRAFEKTKLWEWFSTSGPRGTTPTNSYLATRKTMENILLYLLGTLRPPERLFMFLLSKVRGFSEPQAEYPLLHLFAKVLFLTTRALSHLRLLDFTTITGRPAYLLWRAGLVGRRSAVKRAGTRGFLQLA